MKKKIKLHFEELENEFPTIISSEELKSILGGAYGDASSWGNQDGFLNNVNTMLSSGLLNYVGGSNFMGNYNTLWFSNGSNITSLFGSAPAGNNIWNFGSSGGISFGSAHIGSTINPAPLVGTFNGWNTQFTMPGLSNPTLKITTPGGTSYTIKYSSGTTTLTITLGF
ncbi:hypothetical protein ACFFGT_04075 [Mucilaginibacter angelicae]|uniref:Uncharacterized protein n=1 Tax=Mucilaginibacter angelicae TaxID=869718 RepID=A0ABV6L0V6_9SPHI